MLNFTRIFHAVGQGAFYSERIEFKRNVRNFIAVYDCGSMSLTASYNNRNKQTSLEARIISDLPRTDVEILFISHFDCDHTNGFKFLQPKYVVIPFLTPAQLAVLKILNTISPNTYDTDLAESPQRIFPDSRIIRVMPAGEVIEGANYLFDLEEGSIEISDIIQSGSSITIKASHSNNCEIWEYVVYNPNWEKYYDRFHEFVNQHGLDWNRMTTSPQGKYIKDVFPKLTDIFNKLSSKNKHSLVTHLFHILPSKKGTVTSRP